MSTPLETSILEPKRNNPRAPHTVLPAELNKVCRLLGAAALGILIIAPCHGSEDDKSLYQLTPIVDGLRWPWSIAMTPAGEMLITEREGRLIRIGIDGRRSVVAGTPQAFVSEQGGYFDVAVHPDFAERPYVYLSYSEGTADANGTAVFRARYENGKLQDGERLLRVSPNKTGGLNFGGKMLFLDDNSLLLTVGDGYAYRDEAQNRQTELGKTLRIYDDGRPAGVFETEARTLSRVWSLGHRNAQGLVRDPDRGTVYIHEHGPRGGDELNMLVPGGNYGWPVISHGVDYSGAYVTPFRFAPDMENASRVWTPGIAPSGMAWYRGSEFPEWRDSIFIGALASRGVRRLRVSAGRVIEEETVFSELDERVRDVRAFGDRLLLLTEGENGKLIEVLHR